MARQRTRDRYPLAWKVVRVADDGTLWSAMFYGDCSLSCEYKVGHWTKPLSGNHGTCGSALSVFDTRKHARAFARAWDYHLAIRRCRYQPVSKRYGNPGWNPPGTIRAKAVMLVEA